MILIFGLEIENLFFFCSDFWFRISSGTKTCPRNRKMKLYYQTGFWFKNDFGNKNQFWTEPEWFSCGTLVIALPELHPSLGRCHRHHVQASHRLHRLCVQLHLPKPDLYYDVFFFTFWFRRAANHGGSSMASRPHRQDLGPLMSHRRKIWRHGSRSESLALFVVLHRGFYGRLRQKS